MLLKEGAFLLIIGLGVTLTLAVDQHQEKCVITEGAGIKVDSCDATKYLTCQSGRCMCNDIGNQLYDYRLVPESNNSRSKRSPKKSKGSSGNKKAIGAGIAGGVVGGVAGYQLGKAAGKGSSGSGRDNNKYKKEYSCYGRVGSPCVLDYNNVNVVTLGTTTTSTSTTTTTTQAPSSDSTTSGTANSTTVASPNATTTASPDAVQHDLTKIPKCVRNAICQRQSTSSSLTGHIVKTNTDPRVGLCTCAEGYKATNSDRCEKSFANKLVLNLASFLPLLLVPLFQKHF